MGERFDRQLATVNDIIYSSDTRSASITADQCVAALDDTDQITFVSALRGVLTDAAWNRALDRAADAGYGPAVSATATTPTDAEYVWMICYDWAEAWLATRRHKHATNS